MHDGERGAAVALDQFEAAEQRRHVREMSDVGEEAADLDFGMVTEGNSAQDFDDV